MEVNVTALFILIAKGLVKINIDIFKNENIFLQTARRCLEINRLMIQRCDFMRTEYNCKKVLSKAAI